MNWDQEIFMIWQWSLWYNFIFYHIQSQTQFYNTVWGLFEKWHKNWKPIFNFLKRVGMKPGCIISPKLFVSDQNIIVNSAFVPIFGQAQINWTGIFLDLKKDKAEMSRLGRKIFCKITKPFHQTNVKCQLIESARSR